MRIQVQTQLVIQKASGREQTPSLLATARPARSPRSLLSPRPCKSPTPNAPGGGCAPPALARVTATPRTDPAPACRPGLPRGPQCGAARGYVKVLALHSACASGAHARARRAHTDYSVRLCAAFSILKLGILVPKTAIFFRSAAAEKSSRSPIRLARFLTLKKG